MLLLYEVVRDLEDKLKRLRDENAVLNDKNSVLEDKNSALEGEVDHLKDENSALEGEVERLKKVEKEFEEFKIKYLSVLGKLREALKIKSDKKEGVKSQKGVKRGVRGAPKGHEGGGGLVVPDASVEVVHSLESCSCCGSKLEGGVFSNRVRYIS